jgi:hypothetical protein
MFRRSLVALTLLVASLFAAVAFSSDLRLLAGHCEANSWAAAHVAPPPPPQELGRHRVRVVSTRRIVPGAGLPPSVSSGVMQSNNNLDVVRFRGRTYLAFRTAPTHFPNRDTVMHVVSSDDDDQTWRAETRFALGRDLREPRWLSLNDRLYLYVSVLDGAAFSFRPEEVDVTELGADGRFTPLASANLPGRIAWRIKTLEGQTYMTAYDGGENLYTLGRAPMRVELFTTHDGRRWLPADPDHPVVSRGGGTEADFTLTPGGGLFAVVRNEQGDAGGWGSKLCRAPRGALGDWSCTDDPRKFDSPNVFTHDGEVYFIARRNLTPDGRYDLGKGDGLLRMLRNQLAYITQAKRCALWRYDEATQRVGFVLDLPSRGDTCFASVLPGPTPDALVVYDYSSDLDGPELPWTIGQRRATFIYRHVLELTRRDDVGAGAPRQARAAP